jgi:hypothetical protein
VFDVTRLVALFLAAAASVRSRYVLGLLVVALAAPTVAYLSRD